MAESVGIWDSLVGAAAALAAGGLGAFLADFLGRRRQREQKLDAERAYWREETATVLAQVRALLEDCNLERVKTPEAKENLSGDVRPRWSEIRQRMLRIVAVHPAPQVQDLTWKLVEATGDHVTYMLQSYAGNLTRRIDDTDEKIFNRYYGAAEEAWNKLRDEVRFKDVSTKPGFSRSDYHTYPLNEVLLEEAMRAVQLTREKQSQEAKKPGMTLRLGESEDRRGRREQDNKDTEEGNLSP